MKLEYLDLYDENKNLTGEKIIRPKGKPQVPKNRYINLVIIFIRNSKGEFLFQKTSKEKGSVWATTGGHVQSGQTSENAIINEVSEELGIDISADNFKLIDTSKFGIVFIDTYYLKKDIDINNLKLQVEEVELVEWLSLQKINNLIAHNKLRKSNIKAFEKIVALIENSQIS